MTKVTIPHGNGTGYRLGTGYGQDPPRSEWGEHRGEQGRKGPTGPQRGGLPGGTGSVSFPGGAARSTSQLGPQGGGLLCLRLAHLCTLGSGVPGHEFRPGRLHHVGSLLLYLVTQVSWIGGDRGSGK